MDPITTAILTALFVGVTGGITDVTKKTILDSYELLKKTIKKKLGQNSKVMKAIADLEQEPHFKPYQEGLHQRVKESEIADDPDVIAAVTELLRKCNAEPVGKSTIQSIQNVPGNFNAVASIGSKATVNVKRSKKRK